MGATFKPVVKTRRKDGSRTVYIRVTYGRVSRHIPTTLTATPADLTRSGKIRNATILDRADEIILTMRGTLAGLSPFTLDGWTVDDLVRHIRDTMRGQDFRLDFFEFADAYIASSSLAVSTRGNYVAAVNALARYLGRRSLDVNEITRGMLLGFVDFLNNEPKMYWTQSTGELKATKKKKIEGMGAAMYVRKLAHIFRAARERYNDEDAGRIVIPRQPFEGIRIQTPPHCGQTSTRWRSSCGNGSRSTSSSCPFASWARIWRTSGRLPLRPGECGSTTGRKRGKGGRTGPICA